MTPGPSPDAPPRPGHRPAVPAAAGQNAPAPDVEPARRLLRRLVAHLQVRGRASADALAALALLAARLGHRSLAASLTRVALRDQAPYDYRTAWLLHRLAGHCLAGSEDHAALLAGTGERAVEVLLARYRYTTTAGDVDPINGAGSAGMALWEAAGEPTRAELLPSLRETARAIVRRPRNDLYHGRSGGVLLLRMLGRRYGRDAVMTTAVDTVVRDYQLLDPAVVDTGVLGTGGVTLCSGPAGMLAAVGPAADPAVLAAFVHAPVTRACLDRLDHLLADETADVTVCHGLGGISLGARLSPCWRELVGPQRRARLTERLATYLDHVEDAEVAAVFDTPFARSVLEHPFGVALALAENANSTALWWGAAVSLPDGTPAGIGHPAIGADG
ncbi:MULTISPECIES: hypothetical protein [unclassified Micromonospora]|uniref:hypothetical protein n=1 Tax=unclassified Micromonospora TaxID=2617518 RepID=UPI001B3607B2|nr:MULTISPECIES: hypothetical protein [unclassified Micromonospora]MBQ1041052.1 hypothetical protein [Micromonospora sp. C72]MBQ1055147.1 hypothetical protein [Micromonospora sp. C32]